jgi:serine/threonine protein kinase
MDYAEQTLAQVLRHRGLTADEVQEMIPSILEALAFLHSKNLVQGQLKPANVLVVNDHIKLASDTVHPASRPRASFAGHFGMRSQEKSSGYPGRRYLGSRCNHG